MESLLVLDAVKNDLTLIIQKLTGIQNRINNDDNPDPRLSESVDKLLRYHRTQIQKLGV